MNINSRTSKINFAGFASGDIASFTGLRAAPLKIRADINPIQSGSGDPSPDNIRPISGRDSVTITANSVDHMISLGDTCYGGSLDVTNGVLTVNKKGRYVDSELSISYDATNRRFFVTLPDMSNNTAARNKVILCSTYENKVNVPYVASWDNVIYNSGNDRPKDIVIHDRRYTTIEDFVAYTSQNCFIVYPLATPITVQLTPTQIEQLLGVNNVFADCGNVEVYYVTI